MESDRITAKMIQAGVEVYQRHCPDTCDGGRFDKEMVAEVLKAAITVGGFWIALPMIGTSNTDGEQSVDEYLSSDMEQVVDFGRLVWVKCGHLQKQKKQAGYQDVSQHDAYGQPND